MERFFKTDSCRNCIIPVGGWCPLIGRDISTVKKGKIHTRCTLEIYIEKVE